MTKRLRLAVCFLAVSLCAHTALGAQFRSLNTIARPGRAPEAFRPTEHIQPVARTVVEDAVRDLFASWNNADLARHVDDRFFDKRRLLDAIAENVPRDARVRILSIRAIQTLNQFSKHESATSTLVLSTVSAITRTQVEFNEPVNGFQRRDGTVEYIVDSTMRVRSR